MRRYLLTGLMMSMIILAGCATKRMPWGDPDAGLTPEYRLDEGQVLKYHSDAESSQYMEVMGQSIDVESTKKFDFTATSQGKKGENHVLKITIDAMSADISSPQGDLSPDMSSVLGKSFNLTFSTLGEEIDLEGAKSITYEVEGSKRSVSPDFQMIFPDLAGRPVKIGDTWTSKGDLDIEEGNSELLITLEFSNTLDGFEVIDGLECMRVKADVKGTLQGEGEQQGMALVFDGVIEGTDTWYFAYKEGILVKDISEMFVEGTITAGAPANLTIPMKQEMKMEVSLIK